ncbi:hypothetical protein BJV77DRAFT_1004014 [Russula vinacea]|nr:hypothetical protein BJV77DRAFT_1004014 [Russula vinacea]
MSASAAPVVLSNAQLSGRGVWAPPITNPQAGTVWNSGEDVTVTWDTSTRPGQVSNPVGSVVLGFIQPDGSGGENLDIDNPLAQGFQLDDGQVTFTVPSVPTKNNYIVALIGDSGNISPQFTINGS